MLAYKDMSDQTVALMPAAQLAETSWNLPRADQQGWMRAVCRGFVGSGASVGVGILPVGQRSPLHTPDAEHVLLGLSGQITWRVEGEEYVLGAMDLLFIGADREYEYWNSGFEEARFVDVIGRVNAWPVTSAYP